MNIKKSSIVIALFALMGASVSMAPAAHASFPALTLSSSGSMVQAIVSNADANSTVTFFYPSNGSYSSASIGTTDSNGYLTVQINPGSYGISAGNPVYVRVNDGQSATATWPALSSTGSNSGVTLYLTQTTVNLTAGQTSTITASNVVGSLSIPGNTNPSVASASINGNVITFSGLANGTAAITICATGSGCSTVNVTVQPSYLSSPGVYINPSSMTISAGQSQTATITGYASGPYFVSSNTGSNYVSAAVSNSNVILTGLVAGSSNITICATGGQCGTMFVNVSGTSGSTNVSSSVTPALSSMTISSSDMNNTFVGVGSVVTVTFTANQTIINPQIRVNGTSILANGSGSGPYTAAYTVTGSESMPIPVSVSFANSSGATGQGYFWIGNSSSAPAATGNTVTVVNQTPTETSSTSNASCPVGLTCTPNSTATTVATSASASSYSFTRYLYIGMTKMGVSDPDVLALQKRLYADGFFTGPETGYFGPVTKAAVQKYQAKHGLDPLGVVGPGTRALLNKGV